MTHLFLLSVTEEQYKDLLKEIPNLFTTCGRGMAMIPLLYKVVSGKLPEDNRDVLDLVNRVMVDWARVYKKVRPKKGSECPYYEPSSTMTAFRSLFAFLTITCGWVICLDDLKGFDGCLHFVLTDLFTKRQKEWVSSW